MAKYTTEVRSICENFAGYDASEGYNSVSEIVEKARGKIFNFDYPIFDSAYKSALETKILKHYYGREIGAETVGRWLLWLDSKMNEIMPYYNKLYEVLAKEFDPLNDVNYYRDGDKSGKQGGTVSDSKSGGGTIKNTGTVGDAKNARVAESGSQSYSETSTPKNERWDLYQDTPQGGLTGIRSENYLTNARHIIDDGTGSSVDNEEIFGKIVTTTDSNTRTLNTNEQRSNNENSTKTINTNDTQSYVEHVYGKMNSNISYAKAIEEYRKALVNVDVLIINDLSELFMGLW